MDPVAPFVLRVSRDECQEPIFEIYTVTQVLLPEGATAGLPLLQEENCVFLLRYTFKAGEKILWASVYRKYPRQEASEDVRCDTSHCAILICAAASLHLLVTPSSQGEAKRRSWLVHRHCWIVGAVFVWLKICIGFLDAALQLWSHCMEVCTLLSGCEWKSQFVEVSLISFLPHSYGRLKI